VTSVPSSWPTAPLLPTTNVSPGPRAQAPHQSTAGLATSCQPSRAQPATSGRHNGVQPSAPASYPNPTQVSPPGGAPSHVSPPWPSPCPHHTVQPETSTVHAAGLHASPASL